MKILKIFKKKYKLRYIFHGFSKIINIGSNGHSPETRIQIRISNVISLSFLFGICLFSAIQIAFFQDLEIEFILGFGFSNTLTLVLNSLKITKISRLLQILSVNITTFLIIQVEKDIPVVVIYHILSAFLPFILFDLNHKKIIIPLVGLNLFLLFFSSPLEFIWISPNIHTHEQILSETRFALFNSSICSLLFLIFFYRSRSKMREQIIKNSAKTKQLNLQLTELLAEQKLTNQIIVHDLRNPIGSIIGISDLLFPILKKEENINPDITKYFNIINKSAVHGLKIIEDVRDAFSQEAYHSNFEKTYFSLNQLLFEIENNFKTKINSKEINFKISIDSEIQMNSNRTRLSRAIENALSNAIKFTPENGNIEIIVIEADNLEISVKDSGIGIPNHLQKYLFQKFSKAKRSGLQNETSTGLGMFIIHKIITSLGGTIKIESEENAGTILTFTFPLNQIM